MKIAKLILIGAAAGIIIGCSSDQGRDNGNVTVNKPYVPDVGASVNQGSAGPSGTYVANPTNTIVEPSGAGSPANNR